jgi:hypothetical protein
MSGVLPTHAGEPHASDGMALFALAVGLLLVVTVVIAVIRRRRR